MTADEFLAEYRRLGHAIQTGVAYEMNDLAINATKPKHLRTGLNCVMADVGSLGRLLIAKGLITEDEYYEAMLDGLRAAAQCGVGRRQSDHVGVNWWAGRFGGRIWRRSDGDVHTRVRARHVSRLSALNLRVHPAFRRRERTARREAQPAAGVAGSRIGRVPVLRAHYRAGSRQVDTRVMGWKSRRTDLEAL